MLSNAARTLLETRLFPVLRQEIWSVFISKLGLGKEPLFYRALLNQVTVFLCSLHAHLHVVWIFSFLDFSLVNILVVLSLCFWILHQIERSVLAPEPFRVLGSEPQSRPHSLAGRPMTRRKQRLTGQRSRRWNSKSLLPAFWLQSLKKGKLQNINSTNTSVHILLLRSMKCFLGFERLCSLTFILWLFFDS